MEEQIHNCEDELIMRESKLECRICNKILVKYKVLYDLKKIKGEKH